MAPLCYCGQWFYLSYEDMLQDMEEEEEEAGGRGRKASGKENGGGGSWIKESSGDDPVNLLDSTLGHRISSE